MNQHEAENESSEINRRKFIKGTSFGAMMLMMGGVPLQADDKTNNAAAGGDTGFSTIGAPVSCAVIGCGVWGREVIQTLALLPNAPVVAVCDTYETFLRRGKESAPKAEGLQDYRKVLEMPTVQAVIVATPSHLHREIVVAALKAGKHVYCEAPLASSVEDARAIAQAAKEAVKLNFQAGLQSRSDPRKKFILDFIRSGAIGKAIMARAQWHKKQSWQRSAPTSEREKAANWRLSKETSSGLIGEIGIHQLDLVSWFLNEHPAAVTGFGGILSYPDGRDVADTIQTVFEFPNKANFSYDCTLGNSFDADYSILYGAFAAVMFRDDKAWLFKEVDSPLLGWEIYAAKDQFYKETGISLRAGASKSTSSGKAAAESPFASSALHYALAAFIQNSRVTTTGVNDFNSSYGADADGLAEYLAGPTVAKARLAAAGYKEGLVATVSAIKANEAIMHGQKIVLQKEWFEI
jgi:predicted dehydrogenase